MKIEKKKEEKGLQELTVGFIDNAHVPPLAALKVLLLARRQDLQDKGFQKWKRRQPDPPCHQGGG